MLFILNIVVVISTIFGILLESKLLFVTSATSGAGLLFQVGVLFSTGNARGTALNEVYPKNIKANSDIVQSLLIENNK